MLRSDIRQFVSVSSCRTLDEMVTRDREREIDLDTERKRKPDQAQASKGAGKKPNIVDTRSKGQQGQSHYGRCDKVHYGVCRAGGLGCFRSGRTGHDIGDYASITTTTTQGSGLICFHCSQRGHKKA